MKGKTNKADPEKKPKGNEKRKVKGGIPDYDITKMPVNHIWYDLNAPIHVILEQHRDLIMAKIVPKIEEGEQGDI